MSQESTSQQEILQRIERLARGGGYRLEAYDFVMRGLDFTIRGLGERRHVSGAELVDGIMEFAKGEFGPLAKHVLNAWGIHTSRDFGEIVFELVGEGILKKTEDDCIEDFDGRCDFGELLERDYYRDHPVLDDGRR
jgi:uncharacterized repeat protein (TIGR04138 family)